MSSGASGIGGPKSGDGATGLPRFKPAVRLAKPSPTSRSVRPNPFVAAARASDAFEESAPSRAAGAHPGRPPLRLAAANVTTANQSLTKDDAGSRLLTGVHRHSAFTAVMLQESRINGDPRDDRAFED